MRLNGNVGETDYKLCIMSVSYTQLDVYKRQRVLSLYKYLKESDT